jgi:hypothetical protein
MEFMFVVVFWLFSRTPSSSQSLLVVEVNKVSATPSPQKKIKKNASGKLIKSLNGAQPRTLAFLFGFLGVISLNVH